MTNRPATCLSALPRTTDALPRRQAHTEAMPDEMPWADPVVVPDDIRTLQAEIDAYHREVRAARRRRRRERLTGSWLWRRWSFPLGVLTGAMALAATVVTLLAVDGAARPGRPHAVALARPSLAPGHVGGLVPAASLSTTAGERLDAQALRRRAKFPRVV